MSLLRLLVALALLLPALASAQDFDARRLSTSDTRVLQAALVTTRDYNALLDGAWGRGSQAALERWSLRRFGTARPRFAHLSDLLDSWEAMRVREGWQTVNFDFDLSVAIPGRVVSVPDESEDFIEMASPDGGLVFRIIFKSIDETFAMHDWLEARHVGPKAFYRGTPGGRFISAGELDTGKRVYLWSVVLDNVPVTVLIQSTRRYEVNAALMASSLRIGRAGELVLSRGGTLAALAYGGESAPPSLTVSRPIPPVAEARPESPATVRSSGTGFYVNNTDLVTAAHVVEDCATLSTPDGARLALVSSDRTLDVAVLSSDRRSTDWLPLYEDGLPRLGSQVVALGFPYLGYFDQGLSVTFGNVSALPNRPEDPQSRIMMSTPVQPGNSGGPLIDARGRVVGTVVSRVNDLAVLEDSGTLPQNMNFATPTANLLAFLRGAGVVFPRDDGRVLDVADGLPDTIQRAVVTILCH